MVHVQIAFGFIVFATDYVQDMEKIVKFRKTVIWRNKSIALNVLLLHRDEICTEKLNGQCLPKIATTREKIKA